MSGFPPWSEWAAEDFQGAEFGLGRIGWCSEHLVNLFVTQKGLYPADIGLGIALCEEIKGHLFMLNSLCLEARGADPEMPIRPEEAGDE